MIGAKKIKHLSSEEVHVKFYFLKTIKKKVPVI